MQSSEAVTEPLGESPPSSTAKGGARMRVLAAFVAVLCGTVVFLNMAANRRFDFSVPVSGTLLFVACVALLVALGFVRLSHERSAAPTQPLLAPVLHLVLAGSLLFISLRASVAGVYGSFPLPGLGAEGTARLLSGSLNSALLLHLVVRSFQLLQRVEVFDNRPLLGRGGFWLVLISMLLYVPMLGNYGLIDPWETHYGEVAREILNRDDWISLWWANEGWFMSKPVLAIWLQSFSFSALGVQAGADQMLFAATQGRIPQPEWAARLPTFLVALACVYALYRGCRSALGERASLLGCLVLTTAPHWFFLTHQTMVDIPYVGFAVLSLAMLVLAFHTDPSAELRTFEITCFGRRFAFNAMHALLVLVLMMAVAQIMYLASRHLTFRLSYPPFRVHWDEFFEGSPGSCDVYGNKPCRPAPYQYPKYQPWLVALGSLIACVWFVFHNRKERRVQRLYFIAAWLGVALSFLAKGAPGLVLPVAAAVGFVGVNWRFSDLRRMEWGSLALLLLCVTAPWFVQMYLRHGAWFFDRLFTHHMVKRAFEHVHDTNTGDDTSFRYYIWQLGYALFPWTGLSVGGLFWWLRRDRVNDAARGCVQLLMLWVLASFGMFAMTGTKFHHYPLPLVPGLCMLAGLVLDRCFGELRFVSTWRKVSYYVSYTVAALVTVYGVSRFFPGSILGTVLEKEALRPRSLPTALSAVGFGVALALVTPWLSGVRAEGDGVEKTEEDPNYARRVLALIGLGTGVLVAAIGRDLAVSLRGDVEGPMRLLHLFSYKYSRPWPDSLNFEGIITAFAVVGSLVCVLMLHDRLRAHAARYFMCLACVWCTWALDVYLVKIAPHWSQRETVMRYYQERSRPEEPLLAYQMNWKGENFYTGNHVPIWISSGKTFENWVQAEAKAGRGVMFVTTEHSRVTRLKKELGRPENYQELIGERDNNKFTLARFEIEPPPAVAEATPGAESAPGGAQKESESEESGGTSAGSATNPSPTP